MLALVVEGCVVVEGRVASLAVVEDLDEVEYGGPQRLAGWPVIAVQQLAFQGGEEALGDGVVKASPMVPIEATRPAARSWRPKARLVYWQPWSLWWTSPAAGWRWAIAMSRASRTSSVRRCSAIDQPTIRREKQSSTTATYSQPSPVRCWVMSATHSRSGPGGVKFRSTRSGAGAACGSRRVRPRSRRRWQPWRPAARISLATRLRPTCTSRPSRSSAYTRGAP
jgi:hypothetical protein